MSTQDVTRLQTDLVAQSPQEIAPELARAVRKGYLEHPVVLMPAGSALAVVDGSVKYVSATAATVEMLATGPKAGHYLAFLLFEDGEWHVYGTARLT